MRVCCLEVATMNNNLSPGVRKATLIAGSKIRIERDGLKAFIKESWNIIEPAPLVWTRHMDVICEHLMAVASGKIRKLAIALPPGLSKSLLVNCFFSAYLFTKDPAFRIGAFSNDLGLCSRDSRRVRTLLDSEWFQERWPEIQLQGDSNKVEYYSTAQQGFRLVKTPRQNIVGHHLDIGLLDDVVSTTSLLKGDGVGEINHVNQWFEETMPTRFSDPEKARYVVIQQRIHQNDLIGWIEENDPDFEILRLPMLYEASNPCVTSLGGDWRTQEGELLCPERRNQTYVDKVTATWPPAKVAAEWQQRPVPAGGATFKVEWFQNRWSVDTLPSELQLFLSFDLSFTDKKTSSYNVGQAWGYEYRRQQYYLLDQIRGHWSFTTVLDRMKRFLGRYSNYAGLLIEAKANGEAAISSLRHEGFTKIVPINPGSASKTARAEAITPLLDSGSVFFPPEDTPWWKDFITECLYFPKAADDDQVDTMTQSLLYLSQTKTVDLRKAFENAPKLARLIA